MPVVTLHRRNALSSEPVYPTYIVGFAIAGAVILSLGVWGLIRCLRKRATAKREENRGAAFLSVRGLVKVSDEEKSSQ